MPEPLKTEGSVEIFCSYAHKDEKLRREFESSVALLLRQKLVQIWHDRQIEPGGEWTGEIDQHLNSADIITLFVSADFLASDYCYEKELARALEREALKEVLIVPIIIRECDWQDALFGHLQAIPSGAKPVTKWKNRDDAWTDVAKSLKGTVRQVLSSKLEKLKAKVKPTFFGVDVGVLMKYSPNLDLISIGQKDAQSVHDQIGRDAVTQRQERLAIMEELQAKIFDITKEIGPILQKPKKRASDLDDLFDSYHPDKSE